MLAAIPLSAKSAVQVVCRWYGLRELMNSHHDTTMHGTQQKLHGQRIKMMADACWWRPIRGTAHLKQAWLYDARCRSAPRLSNHYCGLRMQQCCTVRQQQHEAVPQAAAGAWPEGLLYGAHCIKPRAPVAALATQQPPVGSVVGLRCWKACSRHTQSGTGCC